MLTKTMDRLLDKYNLWPLIIYKDHPYLTVPDYMENYIGLKGIKGGWL